MQVVNSDLAWMNRLQCSRALTTSIKRRRHSTMTAQKGKASKRKCSTRKKEAKGSSFVFADEKAHKLTTASTMAQQPPPEAKPLPSPPTDGITALSFTPKAQSNFLASTSWDGSLRLHDTSQMSSVLSQPMDSGPLLSLATPADTDTLLTGGLDGSGE